jgi:hypothetical protein
VSCSSSSLCVGVDDNGYVATATNPTGGDSAWSTAPVDTPPNYGYYNPFQVVSCPSAARCVAGDFVGNVVSSTNPTGGASAWTVTPFEPPSYGGGLSDLACPSASLCVGVGGGGVVASRSPAGGANAWKVFGIGAFTGGFGPDVACPSVSLCVLVDAGNAFLSTNPAGGSRAWSAAHVDGTNRMTGLSCPSTSLCVAVDLSGNAVVGSAIPTAGQIRTLLGKQLIPHGKTAKIGALLKHGGYSFSFTAPTAGRVVISWYLIPKGAQLARRKPRPVLLARATQRFVKARSLRLNVKLTREGKLLLMRPNALKLTAKGTFTPTGEAAVGGIKKFTLQQ